MQKSRGTELISTHTPLAGRDHASPSACRNQLRFLLTRPSRGATAPFAVAASDVPISTHTPLAGRDYSYAVGYFLFSISTHTPLAGRDNI